MGLLNAELLKEIKAVKKQRDQLDMACNKLSILNEEFSQVAIESIETLEHNKIILTPKQQKFINGYRSFQKMMGTEAEVTIAPPLNAEEQQERKNILHEMVG